MHDPDQLQLVALDQGPGRREAHDQVLADQGRGLGLAELVLLGDRAGGQAPGGQAVGQLLADRGLTLGVGLDVRQPEHRVREILADLALLLTGRRLARAVAGHRHDRGLEEHGAAGEEAAAEARRAQGVDAVVVAREEGRGQLGGGVVAQGEERLVDHAQGDLGRDRPAVGVGGLEREGRRLAGAILGLVGHDLDVDDLVDRGHVQLDRAGLGLVVARDQAGHEGSGRHGLGHGDLDQPQAADEAHAEGVLDLEALDGHHPVAARDGAAHEDHGGVAGLVGVLVGGQLDAVEAPIAGARLVGDPERAGRADLVPVRVERPGGHAVVVGGPSAQAQADLALSVGHPVQGQARCGVAVLVQLLDLEGHRGRGRGRAVQVLQVGLQFDQVAGLIAVAVGDQQQVEGGPGHGHAPAALDLAVGRVDHLGGDLVVGVLVLALGRDGQAQLAAGVGRALAAGHDLVVGARPPERGHRVVDEGADPRVPPAPAVALGHGPLDLGVGHRRAEEVARLDLGLDRAALHDLRVRGDLHLELGLAVGLHAEAGVALGGGVGHAGLAGADLDLEAVLAQRGALRDRGAARDGAEAVGLALEHTRLVARGVAEEDPHLLVARGAVAAVADPLAHDHLEVGGVPRPVEGPVGADVDLVARGVGAPGPVVGGLDRELPAALDHVDQRLGRGRAQVGHPRAPLVGAQQGRLALVVSRLVDEDPRLAGQALTPLDEEERAVVVPLDGDLQLADHHGPGLSPLDAAPAGHVDVDPRRVGHGHLAALVVEADRLAGLEAGHVQLERVGAQGLAELGRGEPVLADLDVARSPHAHGEGLPALGRVAAA